MKQLTLSILFFIFSGHTMAAHKTIYGYVEKVTLTEKNLTLAAKLDTGAKSASLSAIKIEEIERNGVTYLSFLVPSKQGDVRFVSEYIGKVRIKVRSGENSHSKSPIKRPVVLVRMRIGNHERMIPVNLTNRKRFLYPLLLGRDAINAFGGLVDPNTTFTIKTTKMEKNAV